MIKNKMNFKLLNTLLLIAVVYVLYDTRHIIGDVLGGIINITLPFILAFAFAYALYPLLRFLQKKGFPKIVAVIVIMTVILASVGAFLWFAVPMLVNQIISMTTSAIGFVSEKSHEFNIDLNYIQSNLANFNELINNFSKFISDSTVSFVNSSINVITVVFMAFIISIYMLINMDKIRTSVKEFFLKRNKRTYNYVKTLDNEIDNYFNGLMLYILVQFVEYSIIYFLVGHPFWLLMAVLASVSTIIPYFGGIIANIIALVTALFVSTKLFILCLIVGFIFPNIDGMVISPKIYGKTNKIPSMLLIFSVYALGKLLGLVGIIISLPLTIIIVATYRFYKKEIDNKIFELKEKM